MAEAVYESKVRFSTYVWKPISAKIRKKTKLGHDIVEILVVRHYLD